MVNIIRALKRVLEAILCHQDNLRSKEFPGAVYLNQYQGA